MITSGWILLRMKNVSDRTCKENQKTYELNGLYSSPNIIRVIKSRRMRWAGYVARMGEGRGAYRILVR
jgi:hypothetical protein